MELEPLARARAPSATARSKVKGAMVDASKQESKFRRWNYEGSKKTIVRWEFYTKKLGSFVFHPITELLMELILMTLSNAWYL